MTASIKPATRQRLLDRMERIGILEDDLREKFILGSGKGGQKINKTSSCVQLRHMPSGLEVKCQRSRSRELNRYYARSELCDRFEDRVLHEKTEKRKLQEKIRRQKRRRSRRSKENMLEKKRQNALKKQLRRPVDSGG